MIISISGTPGTGKSSVTKILARKLGANLISISSLLSGLSYEWDEERDTKIIDMKDLEKAVRKRIIKGRINIVEGHMSHMVKTDISIILRCNPAVLEKRLKRKRWKREKIRENIEAEILDEITIETLKKQKNSFEIDTSAKRPGAVAALMEKILEKPERYKYLKIGNIDWSEKYKEYLCD